MARRNHRRNRTGKMIGLCEPLEERRLLAIVWTNRGSDNFTAAFPGNEPAARAVVDQAIADWNAIILHFNHKGGGNTFNITFNVANLPGNVRAQGGPTGHDGERVPNAGAITLDNNAAGSGWYVDGVPDDDAEFTTVNAPFSATSAAGAFTGNDLYRTAVHEIGHCVGITSNTTYILSDFLSDLGVVDPNDGSGNLFAYNFGGGAIEATFTNADPGHIYEGPAIAGRPDIPFHPFSLMNSGRTAANNERKLIGDIEATILQQVYGYTIALPSTVNNMMVNANYSTDVLNIVGRPGTTDNANFMLIQATAIPGQLHVTVDGFTEIVPLSQINSIVANGGAGNDLMRVEFNGGRSTTFNGGPGIDTIDFAFATRNLTNILGPTTFNGGPDADFMQIYDNNNTVANTYFIDSTRVARVSTGNMIYDGEVENIFLRTGSAANPVEITSTRAGSKVHLNSAGGQDQVKIGQFGAGTTNILGEIEVQNDPSFSFINIDDSTNTVARNADIDLSGQFGWITGLAPATIFWDNADVAQIYITTGSGADTLDVLRCSERLFVRNSGGEDDVSIGNAVNGVSQVTGLIDVGPNSNPFIVSNLTINDSGGTVGRNYTWTPSGTGVLLGGLPASFGYENILFLFILGGAGNDSFAVNSAVQTPINNFWSLDGGGGADTLTVDDRTMSPGPFTAGVSATDITRSTGTIIFPTSYTVRRNRIETTNYQAHDSCTDVAVSGVAAGQSLNVFTGSGNDSVAVYPIDAAGNLTINGNLFLNAGVGSDALTVSASGTTRSVAYIITHLSGPGILHVNGLGSGLLGETLFDTVTFNAGNGDDTFAVEKLTGGAAVLINGGGGNDTCTIGNGDLSANLTNAAAFTFDGGAGSDRFTIANGLTNITWNYQVLDGSITSQSNTGYSWHSVTPQIESQYVFAGSASDTFTVEATAPGAYSEFNGGAGVDRLRLGLSTNNLEGIRGRVHYNTGADGGAIVANDSADTTGDVVHLDASSLGAFAGDTLFGPGGSLTFTQPIVNWSGVAGGIDLSFGSGADTVYAQPQPTARVNISANGPASAPGDTLNLATAALQNPGTTGTPASGSLTSASHQALNWFGFEGSIQSDPVAPAFVAGNINVNGIPGLPDGAANRQALDVQFSEDVSGRIGPAWLVLTNLTTNTTVPAANVDVEYDAATNIAHFTFPGYPLGILPDGNYAGKVLAGLPDFFGNGLPAVANFNFFFLQGDANHDGRVNLTDFNILASNFGQSNRTFNQGDFNYDGTVNLADFNLLASRFGTTLSAPTARPPGTTPGTPSHLRSLRADILAARTDLPARFSGRVIQELNALIEDAA